MNTSPKIMVLKIQEVVYTLILVFFILTLVLCLFLMFSKKGSRSEEHSSGTTSSPTENDASESVPSESGIAETISSVSNTGTAAAVSSVASTYIAGIYSSPLTLGDSAAEIQVTVESDRIKAIELVNADEAIEVSYPLVSSALENLVTQILEKQKLDGITCSASNRYTSQLLLNAISKALSLAQNEE